VQISYLEQIINDKLVYAAALFGSYLS